MADPISKLIESVSRGIGVVWEPCQMVRITKANIKSMKLISEEKENINLSFKYKTDNFSTEVEMAEMKDRIITRKTHEAIREEFNLEAVIGHAYDNIGTDEVPDEEIDSDWLVRLFNIAKDVSSEEMQFYWGKILAGEIKKPKSFSLRTLDVIKNLTTKEARVFQSFAPCMVKDRLDFHCILYLHGNDLIENHSDNLFLLEQCGLISFSTATLLAEVDRIIYSGDKKYSFTSLTKVKLPINAVTESGIQLLKVMDYESDIVYIERCLNYKGQNFQRIDEDKLISKNL